jgi:hypothetical protein
MRSVLGGVLFAALVLRPSPALAWPDKPLPHDYVLYAAMVTLTTLDVLSSLDAGRVYPDGQYHHYEDNPLIGKVFGRHPSKEEFFAVWLTSVSLETAGWLALPEEGRWFLPVTVILIEQMMIRQNLHAGLTIHF